MMIQQLKLKIVKILIILYLIQITKTDSYHTQSKFIKRSLKYELQNQISFQTEDLGINIEMSIFQPENEKYGYRHELFSHTLSHSFKGNEYNSVTQQFKYLLEKSQIENILKPYCYDNICEFQYIISYYGQQQQKYSFYLSLLDYKIIMNSISVEDDKHQFSPICNDCDIPEKDKIQSIIFVECHESRQQYCSEKDIKVVSYDEITITQFVDPQEYFNQLEYQALYVVDFEDQKSQSNQRRQHISDFKVESKKFGQISYTFRLTTLGKSTLTIISSMKDGSFNQNKIKQLTKYSYLEYKVDIEVFKDAYEINREELSDSFKLIIIILLILGLILLLSLFFYCNRRRKLGKDTKSSIISKTTESQTQTQTETETDIKK